MRRRNNWDVLYFTWRRLMTKLTKRPAQHFMAFFVRPTPEFSPTSWRDLPQNYRVIEYVGPKQFRGRADAWRFLQNRAMLEQFQDHGDSMNSPPIEKWAIIVN